MRTQEVDGCRLSVWILVSNREVERWSQARSSEILAGFLLRGRLPESL
jgi:hypothetical protein